MATITGLTKEKVLEILGEMIVGASVDSGGNLRLQTKNGTIVSGGNFELAIAEASAPVIKSLMRGNRIDLGSISGDLISLKTKTDGQLINAMVTATLTSDVVINSSNLPSDAMPGTQFAFRMTQNSSGNATLTLSGIKKSEGTLVLSDRPNAVDILIFMYDGDSWYAGMMGMNFS